MFDKRLLGMVPGAVKYVFASVAFQWIALIANVVLMISFGTFLQLTFEGTSAGQAFFQLAIIAAIVIAIRATCVSCAQSMGFKAASLAKRTMRAAVYDKLVRLGPAYAEQVSTSEAVQISVEGSEQLEVYFGSYLPQLFYALVAPVTLFVMLAPLSLPAAVVLLVCVPFIPLSMIAIQRLARKVVRGYWRSYADLGGSFLENIQGLTTLKIYRADEAQQEKMNQEAEGFRQATMRLLSMQLNSITVMDLLAYGGAAAGIIVALFQFSGGAASLGAVFAIVFLSAEFFIPMRTLGSFFHTAMNGLAAAEKMFKLLDSEEPSRGSRKVDAANCSIACRGLGYSYDGERQVLSGVDFTAAQGEFTAVVGVSGSGKSTLSGILSGRNAAYEGSVTIGGVDVRDITRASLMKSVTTVSSSSYLFKGSVRTNLLMGDPNASDEELWTVLERCRLDEFVRVSGGLDLLLTEQASNLSGGQRQRLALARALLHDSPIYIFDEATSNIDAESERAIVEVIDALADDKTVIMISHRLSSIREADRIYALEGGHAVESGVHEDLLASGGAYALLWGEQSRLEAYAAQEGDAVEPLPATDAAPADVPGGALPEESMAAGEGSRRQRSRLGVMRELVKLVGPLAPYMALAIALGVLGFLAAVFLTTFGAYGIVAAAGIPEGIGFVAACVLVAVCGVVRGPLRYGEQLCNHYIAFKLLALVRDKMFSALRRLAPAKLESRDKGNLISLITSDVELLEVFYAHTLSPIAIAVIVSLVMTVFIGTFSPWLALLALASYLVVGVVVPLSASHASGSSGRAFRDQVGEMNSFVLDSLRGLRETLQYGREQARSAELLAKTATLTEVEATAKRRTGGFMALTGALVLAFDTLMLGTAFHLHSLGMIDFAGAFICTMALMSSFGPVIAVANLGSTLQQTLASGARVLDILEERPQVEDVSDGEDIVFDGATAQNVCFSYRNDRILDGVSLSIKPGTVVNVAGRSGSGKSTFLKLLMRFWDVTDGSIDLSGTDIRRINTASLRGNESYMTQDTHLFAGTVRENLMLVKPSATDADLNEACRKASLLDLIERLPKGYDTPVGELGDTLSGGERQRLGLARVFLYDAPFVLLDEPTSNLDSLNEAAVLSALEDGRAGKTIVLVSHRASTCRFADVVYSIENGRVS